MLRYGNNLCVCLIHNVSKSILIFKTNNIYNIVLLFFKIMILVTIRYIDYYTLISYSFFSENISGTNVCSCIGGLT